MFTFFTSLQPLQHNKKILTNTTYPFLLPIECDEARVAVVKLGVHDVHVGRVEDLDAVGLHEAEVGVDDGEVAEIAAFDGQVDLGVFGEVGEGHATAVYDLHPDLRILCSINGIVYNMELAFRTCYFAYKNVNKSTSLLVIN